MKIDRDTPMWQLTLGEFLQELQNYTEVLKETEHPIEKKEYVYGIPGLAKLIGCSISHAGRLKRQGVFNEAIKQRNRTIIIDKEKALELFNNRN